MNKYEQKIFIRFSTEKLELLIEKRKKEGWEFLGYGTSSSVHQEVFTVVMKRPLNILIA